MKHRATHTRAIIPFMVCCFLVIGATGCSKKKLSGPVSGGRSAILTLPILQEQLSKGASVRRAAPLGLFTAEFLSTSPTVMATDGGKKGILVQSRIMAAQQTISDPDFELLQAFADALQVDVADLLNRSIDRQQALDTYSEALTNVATRTNDRYKELAALLEELKQTARDQNKEKTQAERDLKKAIDGKDFTDAGEKQKIVLEKQDAFAQTDLKRKETEGVVDTLDKLLTLYGQKILAIQQNREVLVAGNKVVDVPGIEDLKIIERTRKTTVKDRKTGFDTLFQ